MVGNYCFYAFGATIADFDVVSVKDLVKTFADFCGYISTERGVKPDYISFEVTFVVSFCVSRVLL